MNDSRLAIIGIMIMLGGTGIVFSIIASLRIYELLVGVLLFIPIGIGGFVLMKASLNDKQNPNEVEHE